ncbi:MAG: hypothetical protein JW837_04295 [Sedimentisphaerales bacterium]|nr:hypothetical protein [Sedimentisphaerales bacterium]
MSTRKISLYLAACLLLGLCSPQLLSKHSTQRTRPRMTMDMPDMPHPDFERMRDMSQQEQMMYFQEIAEQQRRMIEQQEDLAMQQALGAGEQQWRRIEPRLKKVKALREQAFISIGSPFQSSFTSSTFPGQGQGAGGFSGGFQFQAGGFGQAGGSGQGTGFKSFSSSQNSAVSQTEGERICEELDMLLQTPAAGQDEINLKLAALRQARARAGMQLAKAQQELCQVLNFHQQVRLVLMGLLD